MQIMMTFEEWIAEGTRRFGADQKDWQFICPSCDHVASVQDWLDAGAPEGAIAFSCIGRYSGDDNDSASKAFKNAGGPCNYTGGGLFALNPILISFGGNTKDRPTFAFADLPDDSHA